MLNGTIFIDKLRLHANHGVLPQERIVGNDYLITLRVKYPFENACRTDELTDTISYADLADIIKSEMAVPSALVEHVAGRIVSKIRSTFPDTSYIYIKVSKIAPPMPVECESAGVELIYE